jgi:hypothetical protein
MCPRVRAVCRRNQSLRFAWSDASRSLEVSRLGACRRDLTLAAQRLLMRPSVPFQSRIWAWKFIGMKGHCDLSGARTVNGHKRPHYNQIIRRLIVPDRRRNPRRFTVQLAKAQVSGFVRAIGRAAGAPPSARDATKVPPIRRAVSSLRRASLDRPSFRACQRARP